MKSDGAEAGGSGLQISYSIFWLDIFLSSFLKTCVNCFLGGPPPIPPEFCEPFSRVLNLLCCKTLVSLMNTLLRRANTAQPRAVTDLLLQQVS